MELIHEEQEREYVIQSFMEGEHPVEIYPDLNRTEKGVKKWLHRYNSNEGRDKDLPRGPAVTHNKTNKKIGLVLINIKESLMDGG